MVEEEADTASVEDQVLLADTLGAALLVVLDTLAPAERLAFVLHDVFAVPFDDIAPIVDRSAAAARQLATHDEALGAMKAWWRRPISQVGWYGHVKCRFAELPEDSTPTE